MLRCARRIPIVIGTSRDAVANRARRRMRMLAPRTEARTSVTATPRSAASGTPTRKNASPRTDLPSTATPRSPKGRSPRLERTAGHLTMVRLSSARDAADLRAFKRQVVHEAGRIEDEAEHRARQVLGVDGAAGAERHDGHRSVDADLPAIGAFEACERPLGHEHDDDGAGLHAELKAERA